MASPFPGMDPYIESSGLWEDFHDKLIGEIERTLSEVVPERYSVRLGERSYIVLTTSEEAGLKIRTQADVGIAVRSGQQPSAASPSATAVLEEEDAESSPVTMRALIEVEFRESFVEIHQLRPERRLVTTIEVLSPSNKQFDTPGWHQYYRKRQAHLEFSRAHLVEIDLLRGGRRLPMEDEWPGSPYYLLVCRKERSPVCKVWPAHFVQPLPVMPVPLAAPDPDIPLNLQPMIEAIYKRSKYDRDIDYERPCQPPFNAAETAWLEKRLRDFKPSV